MGNRLASQYKVSTGTTPSMTTQSMTTSGNILTWNSVVTIDCSSGSITATLPSSIETNKTYTITIKRIDNTNNFCKIVPISGEKIDGITNNSIYIYSQNDSIVLTSMVGDSKITADNRSGVGSSMSYLKARTSTATSVANNANFIFNTIESQYGTGISLNTTNGQITLKGGCTYKLTASGSYSVTGWWRTQWFENNVALVGSKSQAEGNLNGADLTNIIVVSPSADAVYEYRNITGSTLTFGESGTALYPWLYIEEISRQTVIVNTVDYLFTKLGTSQSNITNTDIKWAGGTIVGNIPLDTNNGYISLIAGKTYKLTARIAIAGVGLGGWSFGSWVDATTNMELTGIAVTKASNPTSSSTPSNDPNISTVIYTPILNQTVKYRLTNTNGTGNIIDPSYVEVLQIGSTAQTSVPSSLIDTSNGITINGYTKLGSDAPAIKIKKITGTTASTEGGTTSINHGLNSSKIISVVVIIEYTTSRFIHTSYTFATGYQVDWELSTTQISILNHPTNSENVRSKPFRVLITYET